MKAERHKRVAVNKKTLFYRHDQILLENERLRHIMRDMIVILKDANVADDLARIGVRKCLKHALRELTPKRPVMPKETT